MTNCLNDKARNVWLKLNEAEYHAAGEANIERRTVSVTGLLLREPGRAFRFTEVDDFPIIEGFYDTESGLGFRLWRAGRVAIRSTSSTVGTVTPSMTSSGRPGERIPSFTDLFSVVTCSECIDIMGGTVEGRCPECLADRHETCTGRAEVREIVYGEWVISDLGGSQPCWCLDDQCQRARVDRIRRRNKRD